MMEAFGVGAGFLMLLWMLFCGVYAILIFFIPFILHAIMKNTKRTADLLDQMKSFQQTFPGSTSIKGLTPPALPTQTLGSPLVEKPATKPSNKVHDQPTGKSLKFTGLKLGSTCNETDDENPPGEVRRD
jgi:hypothetical protein